MCGCVFFQKDLEETCLTNINLLERLGEAQARMLALLTDRQHRGQQVWTSTLLLLSILVIFDLIELQQFVTILLSFCLSKALNETLE